MPTDLSVVPLVLPSNVNLLPSDGSSTAKPTVNRGTFTVLAGNKAVTRTFMFNPSNLNDNKGISWGSLEVPGASHPVYQYGAGGESVISFSIYLDGDRGRFGRQQARDNTSLSIKDELYWYRSLIYPIQYGAQAMNVQPPLCLFNMGEMYQKTQVLVKKASWAISYWTPKMEPVRAIVGITLAEVVNQSMVRDDILKLGGLL